MSVTLPNGKTYVLNPPVDLQDSVQTRGLDPNARDPHDYLKLVAKTFSAFKETTIQDPTISYIYGLTVDYMYIDKQASVPFLDAADQLLIDPQSKYHVLRINPGACFIDDQFVEFDYPSIFLFDLPTDNRPNTLVDDVTNPSFLNQNIKLFRNLKYKIIIEYKWIQQYPVQKARIKIVVDEPSYDFDNFPYFKLASFNVDNAGNIIKSAPEVYSNIQEDVLAEMVSAGEIVSITNSDNSISYYKRGIDPQQLSKKYIDNYKSLFSNLQDQMYNVFNQAGLGKSTFLVIENNEIQIGLNSGTMVYFDQRDSVYKPALSSRQKTDKVIGLYLYDNINDTHIIFFSGLVDLDPDNVLIGLQYKKLVRETDTNGITQILTFTNRYGLTYNHPLINLEVGNQYFLEDDSRYFNESLLMYDLANYIEWDTRGFISTREYPGAVNVGYAVDRTKLLLNINQSNETDWNNAVDLYGNHQKFSETYLNVYDYYKMDRSIQKLATLKTTYEDERNKYNAYIGSYITLSSIPDITSTISTSSSTPPAFVSFLDWFTNNYILGIDRFPIYSSKVLYNPNLLPIDFTEDNTNGNVIFFNDTFCSGDVAKQNLIFGSVLTLKGSISLISSLLVLVNRTISLYDAAINSLNSTIQSTSNNQFDNELNSLVLIRRLELGDDPDNPNEVIEDVNSNIIRDLDIKYTDENQASISLDTNIRVDDNVSNRQNKILSVRGSITSTSTSISNNIAILTSLKTIRSNFALIKYKLETLLNRTNGTINKLSNRISQLEAQITTNTTNIASFTSQRLNDVTQFNSNSVPALDIFYLSDYERKRYNYTYLVDRLLFEFSLGDSLAADKMVASNKFSALTANGSNEYDKEMARLEVDRINGRIAKNGENIKNYTIELNTILTGFNRNLITQGDKNFIIETDLINENPNNFRFGVDYGPVGSNNERYLINEAFFEVCRLNISKFKDGLIQRVDFPDRFLPAVYTITGSGLTSSDFDVSKFKTLTFSNNGILDPNVNPYFYITLDKVKTLCYIFDGKYYIYKSNIVLPTGLNPPTDYNSILDESYISNVNKDIIQIYENTTYTLPDQTSVTRTDGNFYVNKTNENSFIKLTPVPLNSEELSRFVREARVKSISEEYNNIVTYVGFMNYFIRKESVLVIVNILNSYIDTIQSFEIIGYTNIISVDLPVIASDYTSLITNVTASYASYLVNRNHLNELITILSLTGQKDNLSVNDISDTVLITYGLGSSFRTESKEMRSQKLTMIMDNYRTLLFSDIDNVILEIKKYRDTTILDILSNNTEFNA